MRLRTRLALTYGIGLAAGLIVFAVLSVVTIDRILRVELDERLATAARAAAAISSVEHGRINIEPDDRTQLASIYAGGISGAIVSARVGVIFQAAGTVPAGAVIAIPSGVRSYAFDAGSDAAPVRVVAVPLLDPSTGTTIGEAIAWNDRAWIGDVDRSAIVASGAVAVLIAGLALLLSGLLARRALSPLQRLSTLAAEIEAHDLSQRLDEGGVDELARLCAAFNRMLERLERAFTRQQRFTADASHEFRAPMAVIRAEADLALRRDRTTAEYRRALDVIVAETARMENLVESLLDAARADEGPHAVIALDLRTAAESVVDRLAPSARAKSVALEACGGSRPIVDLDPAELTRALTAIVHNAIVHTPPGGRIVVAAAHDSGAATISVRDTGPGFDAQALEHATERFWRGDLAHRAGSTGLGLAIARTLVERGGGMLTLENAGEGGALVTMRFRSVYNPFIVES